MTRTRLAILLSVLVSIVSVGALVAPALSSRVGDRAPSPDSARGLDHVDASDGSAPSTTSPTGGATPSTTSARGALATPSTAPAAPTAPAGAANAAVRVLEVPTTLDSTGRTDVTAGLNAFFASVPDDSVLRFPRGARYRIEETVELVGKNRILLDGQGAELFAETQGDRNRSHLAITQSSDITVRSLKVRGSNPLAGPERPYFTDFESQHGVRILGGQRVRLENLTVSEVWGDLVYVGRTLGGRLPGGPRASTDVAIVDCRLTGSGRQGIALTTAHRVLIDSNRIAGSRRSIIDLEPNSPTFGGVSDVVITRNVVRAGRFNFVAAAGNGPVNDVWVLYNRGIDKALSFVIFNRNGAGRSNWRIVGNVSNQPYGSLKVGVVVAKGASGVVYQDNVQPIQPNRGAVGLLSLKKTCGAVASGNELEGAPQIGGRTLPCPGNPVHLPPDPPVAPALPTSA